MNEELFNEMFPDELSNDDLWEYLRSSSDPIRITIFRDWVSVSRRSTGYLNHEEITELIEQIKTHYQRIEPEMIERLNNHKIKTASTTPPKTVPQKLNGYVYLIRSDKGFKIGYTAHPEERMGLFVVNLPFEVEYECLIPTDDMRKLEKKLHLFFDDKRLGGEWFDLSEKDVEYIKSLAEQNHEW